jgi:hypothetical protein
MGFYIPFPFSASHKITMAKSLLEFKFAEAVLFKTSVKIVQRANEFSLITGKDI